MCVSMFVFHYWNVPHSNLAAWKNNYIFQSVHFIQFSEKKCFHFNRLFIWFSLFSVCFSFPFLQNLSKCTHHIHQSLLPFVCQYKISLSAYLFKSAVRHRLESKYKLLLLILSSLKKLRVAVRSYCMITCHVIKQTLSPCHLNLSFHLSLILLILNDNHSMPSFVFIIETYNGEILLLKYLIWT